MQMLSHLHTGQVQGVQEEAGEGGSHYPLEGGAKGGGKGTG